MNNFLFWTHLLDFGTHLLDFIHPFITKDKYLSVISNEQLGNF